MAKFEELQRVIKLQGTKSNLLNLTGTIKESIFVLATDTSELGIYDGTSWKWFGSGSNTVLSTPPYISIYDDGVLRGSGTSFSFDKNLVIGISGTTVHVESPVSTYQRFGQPIPLNGITGTIWQVPDRVYASGSLGVFYNGLMQAAGVHYEELIFVSGTYNLLFVPATGTYHMVSYGVPCIAQTYSTGTGASEFALVDSDTELLLDSDSEQLLDSDG